MKYTTGVVSGHGRGKNLGFPTLNLMVPEGLEHELGVYAGWVWIDGRRYKGGFHFGEVPVFAQKEVSLEVFVLDVGLADSPDEVEFELVERLRGVQDFESVEALVEQIGKDVERVREVLAE